MPSSFSSNLRVELQATGENTNTWGTILNSAVFELFEDAIAGVTSVVTTGGVTTLTTANGLADEARAAALVVTGALVSNATIRVPAVSKLYTIRNATSGGFTVSIEVLGGTAVTIPQGTVAAVFVDGTNTYLYAAGSATALPSAAVGNLAATNVQAALQELQGDIDVFNGAEADVASAATTAIGGVGSRNVRITGTTTITSFGTVAAGTRRNVRMAGALTLTHNATSLILPGGANITTAAGDTFEALSLGSGNWFVAAYQRANGETVASVSLSWRTGLYGSTRTTGVTYTNDSGKDRWVFASFITGLSGTLRVDFLLNGTTIGTSYGTPPNTFTDGVGAFTVLIPPGATYRFNVIAGGIGTAYWNEYDNGLGTP